MKTRIILFLAIAAVITLSFTFVSVSATKETKDQTTSQSTLGEPVGGLVSEGQL